MRRNNVFSPPTASEVFDALLCIFILMTLFQCSPSKEHGMSLTGSWLFKSDPSDIGTEEKWFEPGRDRSDWQTVDVPGRWDRYNLKRSENVCWYSRKFALADTMRPLALFFGGVDDNAEIWLNGQRVGEHVGYGEQFWFDVTSVVKQGENDLVVCVRDRLSSGGIYEPVVIIPLDEIDRVRRLPLAGQPARTSADWVKDATIYEVSLRSFSNEGTFKGLEQRLPELKQLGVTVLWLMPIHPVGEVNRKGRLGSPYAVQDYYEVNPEFGTLEDFKSLVGSVHEQGMKVIIDLVANHAAWDSKLMFEHSDWFTTDDSGAVVSPNPDWTDVADLNYGHHELRKYMIAMMQYWVGGIGVDGFRCDVAELVPTDFWEVARNELEKARPVLMLAEGSWPEHHREAFDITYSWGTSDILERVFLGTTPASALSSVLVNERDQFPQGALRLRFYTNHDKNAWDAPAVEKYGAAGAKVAAVLMMTFPGIPLIYNGEEVGNPERLSLFESTKIDWTKRPDFRKLYQELGVLRNAHGALRRGEFRPLENTGGLKVYSFLRTFGSDQVLVVMNFSDKSQSFTVQFPEADSTGWKVALSSEQRLEKKGLSGFALSPFGYIVSSKEEVQ